MKDVVSLILFCDEEPVGKLKVIKLNEKWVVGRFASFNNFKKFKPLFRELERAWICENEDYFEFQEQVDNLNFLVSDGAKRFSPISDFKIINGNFEYKLRH